LYLFRAYARVGKVARRGVENGFCGLENVE
jgi:hypothetical protein